jgi:hypothetical protein
VLNKPNTHGYITKFTELLAGRFHAGYTQIFCKRYYFKQPLLNTKIRNQKPPLRILQTRHHGHAYNMEALGTNKLAYYIILRVIFGAELFI